MTKILKSALVALLVTSCCVMKAETIEYTTDEGFSYRLDTENKEASLYKYNKYSGATKDVVVPESVTYEGNNYNVTSLGDYCFDYCSSLTSIEIPESVTSLGEHCFDGCSSLASLKLPSSVTSLGDFCFWRCSSLTSIEIPESVTSLGIYCFSDCSSLTSIEIPKSVTYCGYGCFGCCSSLESIVVDAANPNYDSREGCNAIINTKFNTMIAGCKNTKIPSSVTSLGIYCFGGCSSLTSIEIPESVTWMDYHCFYSCSSLTSIEIPSSVTGLGWLCFDGCSSLKSIKIPASVKSLNSDNCFSGCSSLESIVVDAANPVYDSREGCNAIIETKSNTMITGCKNTKIPLSVTSLGGSCFSGCSSLTSIEIPASVTSLDNCFSGSSLESIVVDAANPVYDSREGCNAIIETASNRMIRGCKNTQIPSSVTSLGRSCFSGCSSLASIEIPSSVTSLGGWCFSGCSSLTSIEIPSSVTSWGERCFRGCSSLKTVISKMKTGIEDRWDAMFEDSSIADATLYVPESMLSTYQSTYPWRKFGSIQPLPTTSDNYLTLHDAEACRGSGVLLPVDMHNSEAVTALQFELSLPTGVTLSDCLLTGRKGDHTVSYSRLANGNYQVIVFSMNNRNFLGSEGSLLELSLDVDGGVPSGDYLVLVKNIELTTSDTQAINPDEARATLTVSDVRPGDANGDGKISVTDVVAIANHILGKRVEGFRFAAADMNGDGKISITDAVAVVNKILEGGASARERGAAARLDPQ